MAATFNLRILTPTEEVFDDEVVSIIAPGETGYLGVLAHHAPLITTLTTGDLKIRMAGKTDKWYRVRGGILRVARNRAVLLSEGVEETSAATG